MPAEVLAMLALRPGQFAVDATVGAGGHSAVLLAASAPNGRLLCLDVDPAALEAARARLEPLAARERVQLDLVQANFRELPAVLAQTAPGQAPHAILADLGVSSMQLDRPERGFSFRYDAPLDLRMDPELPRTGADLLRELPEKELADLLYHLGDERGARRIARYIVQARERGEAVATTEQLARLVLRALKVRGHARIHPATRTFQALRMAVNQELPALEAFLEAAPESLAPGGVLAILSFHSGEDRLVKHRFKALAATGRFQLLRKSVLRPGPEEQRGNPRSRSARLRALRRM
jgi:16S rRNA (cytosine1402-N4)-methyltransferase